MPVMEPGGIELEQRDERDRYAQPDQQAPDRCEGERIGHAEQQRTDAADQAADSHDTARPQRVDQDAGGDLHHHVHVEIGRRQTAQLRRAGMEGLLQIGGDRRRCEAMEERQHIRQTDDDEGGPAQAHELARLMVIQHELFFMGWGGESRK